MLDKSRDQLSTGRQQARTTTSRTTTTKTTTTKTKTCSETVFDIKPFWWWIRLIFGSSYRIVFRVSKQVIMGEDTVEIQVQLPESSLKHVEVLARKVADNKVDLVFRINKKFLGTHRHELVIHSLPTTVEKWFPEQSNCPVWQASGGDHSPLARAEPSSRAAGGGVFHRAGHDQQEEVTHNKEKHKKRHIRENKHKRHIRENNQKRHIGENKQKEIGKLSNFSFLLCVSMLYFVF